MLFLNKVSHKARAEIVEKESTAEIAKGYKLQSMTYRIYSGGKYLDRLDESIHGSDIASWPGEEKKEEFKSMDTRSINPSKKTKVISENGRSTSLRDCMAILKLSHKTEHVV